MGTYTLVISNSENFETEVGSIGNIQFQRGIYVYTGSVPKDTFPRVRRHMELSEGYRDVTHWHIDYLLIEESSKIIAIFKTDENIECEVNCRLGAYFEPFENLGASDCSECSAHLQVVIDEEDMSKKVSDVYKRYRSK